MRTTVLLLAGAILLSGCGLIGRPDACGQRALLKENLRIAAEKHPVPDWNISMQDRSTEALPVWWTAHTRAELQPYLEKGQLHVTISAGQAEVMSWGGSLETGKERALFGDLVRFPQGGLQAGASLTQVLEEAKRAMAAGQVQAIGTWSYKPVRAPSSAREPFHEWNLQDAYRWYERGLPCVTKTVVAIDDGPIRQLDLPMLEVGRWKYVGFLADKVVTLEQEAGLFGGGSEVIWYSVPGIRAAR